MRFCKQCHEVFFDDERGRAGDKLMEHIHDAHDDVFETVFVGRPDDYQTIAETLTTEGRQR